MKLSELLENIDVLDIKGVTDMNISGITFNSKEVKPGYLFVCIKGFTTDGHSFARNAIDAGAVAILAEHFIDGIEASTVVVEDTRAVAGKMTAKRHYIKVNFTHSIKFSLPSSNSSKVFPSIFSSTIGNLCPL